MYVDTVHYWKILPTLKKSRGTFFCPVKIIFLIEIFDVILRDWDNLCVHMSVVLWISNIWASINIYSHTGFLKQTFLDEISVFKNFWYTYWYQLWNFRMQEFLMYILLSSNDSHLKQIFYENIPSALFCMFYLLSVYQ
jgi:predicted methyltransferase